MWADGVVKGLNIGEEISRSGAAGIIAPQVNQLAFQAAEKVFGHGVVIRVALAGHALTDAQGSRSRKAAAAYWPPRSLWKISPGPGRSRRTAMSSAARVSWVSMRLEKAQPTAFLVHKSLTTAKYSRPSAVGM